ncbi:MAG: hypothetical protein ACOYL3_08080 [Desulfuromonadaceae bacterium]
MNTNRYNTNIYDNNSNQFSYKLIKTDILLILFFISLYVSPYFKVQFSMPSWLMIREILFAVLALKLLFCRKNLNLPRWMLLYIYVLVISFAMSDNYSVAFTTLRTLLQFVAVYIFSRVFITDKQSIIFYCKLFYIFGMSGVVLIIFQLIYGPVPVLNMYASLDEASMRYGYVRLSTIYGNTITSAMLIIIFCSQVYYLNKRLTKIILLCCAVLSIIASFSKAPSIVLFLLMIYFYYESYFKNRPKNNKISPAVIILSFILLLALFYVGVYFLPQLNNQNFVQDVSINEQLSSDTSVRFVDKPKVALDKMLDIGPYTLLIGAGFDAAGQAAAELANGIKPHNALVEIFITMGVLGILVYGNMFALLVKLVAGIKTKNDLDLHVKSLAVGVIAALLSALVVDPHVTHVLMVPAFFLLGISDSYKNLLYNETNDESF